MTTPRGDVDAALAGLQARWGAATRGSSGRWPSRRLPDEAPDQQPEHEPRPRRRPRHPHRLRRARRDPRPGRPPDVGQRRHPRRRLERPDHARPAGRRGGPGAGLGRGLAGPVAQLRPGRGRRPRHPPRVARRHHPGQPGRGPVDRGQPAGRPLGRPARPRPARRSTGPKTDTPARSPIDSIDSPRSPGARRRCS